MGFAFFLGFSLGLGSANLIGGGVGGGVGFFFTIVT